MKIGIYGLGRFGSFWAKSLADSLPCDEIVAFSRHSKPEIPNVRIASEDEVLSSDALFFCVTISAFKDLLSSVAKRIPEKTIVMDTCSVKTYPAAWMKDSFEGKANTLIATHPMFGPDSGKNGLRGLPVVMCPITWEDEGYRGIKERFQTMELDVLEMSPREHDRKAAYSQGVTHFVGRTLKELGMVDTPIATKGYKSLMTIVEQTCNDPIQLFYDLQRYNPYAKEMRLSLQVALEKTLNSLAEQEEK